MATNIETYRGMTAEQKASACKISRNQKFSIMAKSRFKSWYTEHMPYTGELKKGAKSETQDR